MIGKRITPTDLPQTVAALHSVVGLAAVLTSIGSVMANVADVSTLHMVTAYAGVLVGNIDPFYAVSLFIVSADMCQRWHNLYRIHRRLSQAGWAHVVASEVATGTTRHQRGPAGDKRGDYGCLYHHGAR